MQAGWSGPTCFAHIGRVMMPSKWWNPPPSKLGQLLSTLWMWNVHPGWPNPGGHLDCGPLSHPQKIPNFLSRFSSLSQWDSKALLVKPAVPPPPPVISGSSSLLYCKEVCDVLGHNYMFREKGKNLGHLLINCEFSLQAHFLCSDNTRQSM